MTGFQEYKQKLKERLDKERFEHSLGTAGVARDLASRYGYDEGKAYLAGLLHDYARGMSDRQLLQIAESNNLISHPVEEQVPVLLHGPVGSVLVRRDLGIEDREILEAISRHTTGFPGMSPLAEIIYLADIIEPSRNFDGIERLRSLSIQNLHIAVIAAIDCSIRYCLGKGLLIHPASIEARNEILGKINHTI